MIGLITLQSIIVTKCSSGFKNFNSAFSLLFIWLSAFEVVLNLSGVRTHCTNNEGHI